MKNLVKNATAALIGITALCVAIVGNAQPFQSTHRIVTAKEASANHSDKQAVSSLGLNCKSQAKKLGQQFRRVPAGDLEGRNLTLLCREDFSKFTAGSEEAPDGSMFETLFLTDEFFQTPGWSGEGVYQAGGTCALAFPSIGGFINSPLGYYAGKIIVKFRAKAAEGNGTSSAYMFVSLLKDGVYYPNMTGGIEDLEFIQLKAADGWQDLAYEMVNPYYVDDAFVQFNAVTYIKDAIFIDDIEIYRDEDYLYQPKTLTADTFTKDGFTARWGKVVTAEGYLLNLYEELAESDEPVSGLVDFNGISTETGILQDSDIPENWDIHLTSETQVTADGGADGSPAIILSSTDEYICLPQLGGTFSALSFFAKLLNDPETNIHFYVDVLNASTSEWKTLGYYDVNSDIWKTGTIKTFEDGFSGLYKGVRLRLEGSDEGLVAVDNISFQTTAPVSSRCVAENIDTTEPQYTFTGLNPDAEHYFTVTAYKGNKETEPTNRALAFGIADPVAVAPTDVDARGGFTANWEQTPRATRYDVYAYELSTFTEDSPEYELINEDFSKVTSAGTPENPEALENTSGYMPLDDYTSVPGWTGRGNIIANGMLGCADDYSGVYEIITPVITLSNNNGNYKVYIKVWSTAGATLIVQGTDVYQQLDFTQTGTGEITFDLNKGKMSDQLMFYTQYGEAFLIDEVKIMQDVKAGDRLYSEIERVEAGDATSHYFTIYPEEGRQYGYCVVAYQDLFGNTYATEPSNVVEVDFFSSGIENVGSGESFVTKIFTEGNDLKVVLAGNSAITVYNLQGQIVATANGVVGVNSLTLPTGMYIVTAGGKAQKVLIGNN